MGKNVEHSHFSQADHDRFTQRLYENLDLLELLLATPGFGQGETSIGAELELDLIDPRRHTLWINAQLLKLANDPQLTYEVNQYNLEYNLTPVSASGHPFTCIGREISSKLKHLNQLAADFNARAITIGILPTLSTRDIRYEAMTDYNRYRILARELNKLRHSPNRIDIQGHESLELENVVLNTEGANTSFQIHLRTETDDFKDLYNAAQLASAPALAIGTNSPFFMQKQLWEETRIPLFEQLAEVPEIQGKYLGKRAGMDEDWVKKNALELFRRSVENYPVLIPECTEDSDQAIHRSTEGGAPDLFELRLHHGSIWHWNRAIYDPAGNGHIRMELRSLPSGPTVIDMMANAAFLIGLTAGLKKRMQKISRYMPFDCVKSNFYLAARTGMDAVFDWPADNSHSMKKVNAVTLASELLVVAEQGLKELKVKTDEITIMLDTIEGRLKQQITGARWQINTVKRLERNMPRKEALDQMLMLYIQQSELDKPVHLWPLPC